MSVDLIAAKETVWDALHAHRTNNIPWDNPEHDREWDDICTAMAILQEEAGCPEQVDT